MALLGPPVGYVDLLAHETTAKLQRDRDSGKDYQKSPIRPSSSGECTRALYYDLLQYSGRAKFDTPLNEPELVRLFALGHSIESHLIRQLELLSGTFEIRYKQQVLSFKYLDAATDKKLAQWLEGSLDLVFWSEKWKCVADVKSKKDRWSAGFKSNWDETSSKLREMQTVHAISDDAFWVEDLEAFLKELNDPFFAANFLQLNLYANSDFLKERGVDHGAILQYCKNDSRLREIRFKPSRALFDQVVAKFQTVIDAVDSGDEKKARRDFMLGSMKCAFCKFSTECWGQDAKKAWYNTMPPRKWPADTDRMGESGDRLEALFESYKAAAATVAAQKFIEQDILKELEAANESKVRLADGSVYEIKQLKDGPVIRRSKA
jgi:hypothetical protein